MLCLGPGPSSLLHLTRANAEKPYVGGTLPPLVRRPVAASKLGEFLPGLSSSFSRDRRLLASGAGRTFNVLSFSGTYMPPRPPGAPPSGASTGFGVPPGSTPAPVQVRFPGLPLAPSFLFWTLNLSSSFSISSLSASLSFSTDGSVTPRSRASIALRRFSSSVARESPRRHFYKPSLLSIRVLDDHGTSQTWIP